jgi:hypothetical protein
MMTLFQCSKQVQELCDILTMHAGLFCCAGEGILFVHDEQELALYDWPMVSSSSSSGSSSSSSSAQQL